jgi:hypothetical protein
VKSKKLGENGEWRNARRRRIFETEEMRIPLKRSFGILNGFVKVENTKTVAIWYSHLEACK